MYLFSDESLFEYRDTSVSVVTTLGPCDKNPPRGEQHQQCGTGSGGRRQASAQKKKPHFLLLVCVAFRYGLKNQNQNPITMSRTIIICDGNHSLTTVPSKLHSSSNT